MSAEFTNTGMKRYEIRQLTDEGNVLSANTVEAMSSEAAAKQLKNLVDGTGRIEVCLDGKAVNEMGVNYWRQRVRHR